MKRILSILLVLTMLLAALIIPVSADEAQVPEVLGASIRTTSDQGLRFIGRIKKTGSISLTFGDSANVGFLIIPESSIASGTSINKDTPLVSNVKAVKTMGEGYVRAAGLTYDEDYYYFSVVQMGIPAQYYETNMVVKAYVNNGGTYTYSNSGSTEKRSIQYVAQAISDMGGVIPAFITEVLTKTEKVGTDIVFNGDKLSVLTKYPDYPACIARDALYSVSVSQGSKNQSLLVYNQTAGYSMYDSNNSSSRTLGVMDSNRRFCEFAFAFEKVTVNVKVNKKFTSYVVSPTSKGFASSYDSSTGTISVTLDKPTQFVIILDNDYKTALAVFADAPETDIPTKGASNVVYVEGDSVITAPDGLVSYVGTNNTVMVVHKRNTKIYLAPGAVLKKRIFISRVDQSENSGYGSKIYGRGAILDPNSDYTISDPRDWKTLNLTDCYDNSGSTKSYPAMKAVINVYSYGFRMEDVKVLDARNFNVLVAQESGNGIDNVKLLSTEMSTDGFMITGNHKITNCFVHNGDNALVMTGGSLTGHYYENITIGTTCAAIYPQYGFNGTLKNIYVFRADDNLINVHEDNSGAMAMNIDGLDALDCVKTPLIFGDNGSNGSETKTFNLKNVVLRKTTGSKTSFTPGANTNSNAALECSSSGYILNFTNLYVGGSLIGPGGSNGIKVGSTTIGNNSAYGSTISGMTINFAHDSDHEPAHTAVPADGTANYTAGAAYVAGPIRGWSEYTSYNCIGYIDGGQYKVEFRTDKSASSRWGYCLDLTEQMKVSGAGTYSFSVSTSGNTTSAMIIRCANNSNSCSTVSSSKSGSITVTADNLANYTYHIIVKSGSTSGSFTLTGWSFSKN